MRGDFVIAHTIARQRNKQYVGVHRTFRRASLATALKKASAIRRCGYLVWIEADGQMATRR